MRARTIMVVVAVVVGVGAGLIAWSDSRWTGEAEQERVRWTREKTGVRSAVARAEVRLKTAEGEREKLRTAAKAAGLRPVWVPRPADELTQKMRKDPALQALKLAAERAKNAVKYGPMFRRLGLTAEQSEGFLASVARLKEQDADCDAAVQSLGLAEDDEAIARLRGKAFDEAEAVQRALLGEERLRQARDYEKTLMLRGTVAAFASSAVMAGLALTTQQAEEMTQIVIGASERWQPEGWVVANSTDWEVVDARARGVLSVEQFALFQAIEPHARLDGMDSRFSARLDRLSDQAREADMRAAAEAAGVVKSAAR